MQDETGAAAAFPIFSVRKGSWTEEEDILLRRCIAKYGEGDWHQVPKRAGLNRCRKSCRLRWLNYLRPNIKRGRFSPDEVDFIIRLHKLLGNRWALIAGRLPGRTTNDVKNYWNTHHHKKRSPEIKKSINTTSYTMNGAKTTFATTTEIIKPQPMTFKKTSPWLRRIYSGPIVTYNHQNIATCAPEQQQQQPIGSMLLVNEGNPGAGANAMQLGSLLEQDQVVEEIDNNLEPDSELGSRSRSVSGLLINCTGEDEYMVPRQMTNDVTNNCSPQEKQSINSTAYTTKRVASTTFSTMTEVIKPQPRTFSKTSLCVHNRDSKEMLTYDEQNSTVTEQQQIPLSTLFHAQEDNISDNKMWWESLLELDEVTEKMVDNNIHEPNSGSGSQSKSMSVIATSSTSEDEHMVKPANIINEEEAFVGAPNNWDDFCLDIQFWDVINGT